MPAWLTGDGGSLVKRVDAISIDYLTRASVGPEGLSDSSMRALVRPWLVDAKVEGEVWISRGSHRFLEVDWDNPSWEAPTLLFSYSGPAIYEIDLAFDQNAAPVVVAQRHTGPSSGPELWVYYYDSLAASYQFLSFGPGRTPRAVLDDPLDESGNSDVVIFYLDASTQELKYRQQRDRYDTEYIVPAEYYAPSANNYIEEVAQGRDSRVQVWFSSWDEVSGRYIQNKLATMLYPTRLLGDVLETTVVGNQLILKRELWEIAEGDVLNLLMSEAISELRVASPITELRVTEDQHSQPGVTSQDLNLRSTIFESRQKQDQQPQPLISTTRLELARLILEHRQPRESEHNAPAISVQRLEIS